MPVCTEGGGFSMRFALVDDRKDSQEHLLTLLREFCEEHRIAFTADCFFDGETFLSAFVPLSYDMVFMDIYMNGMTGIETAERMRKKDSRCLLVFITTSMEHMGNAFSAHAFDYIAKPFDPARIHKCMADALRILPKSETFLSFCADGVKIRLSPQEVCSVQSSLHSVILTDTECREYVISASFTSFVQPLISRDNFLLVSRGILVNLDYVTGFSEKECRLQNGTVVPITMRKQKQLVQIWRNYDFAKLHRQPLEKRDKT